MLVTANPTLSPIPQTCHQNSSSSILVINIGSFIERLIRYTEMQFSIDVRSALSDWPAKM